jgi:hypothetical protein
MPRVRLRHTTESATCSVEAHDRERHRLRLEAQLRERDQFGFSHPFGGRESARIRRVCVYAVKWRLHRGAWRDGRSTEADDHRRNARQHVAS